MALGRCLTRSALAGFLIALAGPLLGQSPTLTVVSPVNGGTIVLGGKQGQMTLSPSPLPTGTRTATGDIILTPSFFSLGAFRATGPLGGAYTVANLEPQGHFKLEGPGGPDIKVPNTSLVFSSTYPRTFTANPPVEYFGLLVDTQRYNNNPPGTYTGQVTLQLSPVGGGPVARATFPVTLKIQSAPITIAKAADLSFGGVLIGQDPGTVTLAPGGARTFSGGASGMAAGTFGAAAFTVTAPPGATYTFALPQTAALTWGSETLTVDAFTRSPSGSLTMGALGFQVVSVGARILLPGGKPPGTYAGTFPVTVAYD